jgi:glutamine synthetase
MSDNLTLETLKSMVAEGRIDTVITCFADMQGRLQGKRFHAAHFVNGGHEETHCCNYLIALDMEMVTVPGYKSSSWEKGYGDYTMKPDLSTLRLCGWEPGCAMVLCDLYDHETHALVPHAPRSVLRAQVDRARAMGYDVAMATELEFFLFEESYTKAFDTGYRTLTPNARHNIDYAIFGASKDEVVMRPLRNALYASGIHVECAKGEAEAGQEEINAKYSDAIDTADTHSIIKLATKECAQKVGLSATFMAKYHHAKAGSSSHVHQSLWKDGEPAFLDTSDAHGMSDVMKHFLAGQLKHAREITYFLAPYVNSYKRFVVGMFAPTKAVWSTDNRTAGFRICGTGTKAIRVECRIGGADLNPYLALAALLAAGLEGVAAKLPLEREAKGDLYAAGQVREVPKTIDEAIEALKDSTMLRNAMGDDVVDHYVHCGAWEIRERDRVVTDWEVARGFERA